MNYLDVYFSRINHFGETQAERIKNIGILSFEKWMAQSPFTVTDLSVERGLYFSGIIQTNKDKEELKLMYLYVANDIPIKVGDILTWRQDNGAIEKWLILQQIHKVHGTYQTFQIIKCNYLIKWIDENGRVRKSWAYAVSSTDDKVKANFRMWHALISPQPNKYAEIIMPRQDVDRGTKFIIEDEGWLMIEADFTSVEGIIYMSLTEDKVNYQYDDREVDIADVDRLAFPTLNPTYTVGDYLIPNFGENTFNEWDIELVLPEECNFIIKNDNGWQATAPGQCMITMRLKGQKAVTHNFEVTINASGAEFTGYINGADTIRLDRYESYELVGSEAIVGMVTYSLETTNLATISSIENNKCIIHANAKNKLGEVTLKATYNGTIYTKIIKIAPLW